jgi:hypothetical protein
MFIQKLRVLNVVGGQHITVSWRCKSNLDYTIKIHTWIPSRSFISDCFTELLYHSFWATVEYNAFCDPTSTALFHYVIFLRKSHDSSVGIALGYGLDDWGSRVWFPAGAGNFSLHLCVQNGSGAHPASCPVGTRGSFPEGKAAGAWSWPLTSI